MLNTVLLLTVVFFWHEKYLKTFFEYRNRSSFDRLMKQENIPKSQLLSEEYHCMSQKI